MDVNAYLERIHYTGPLLPDLETLQGLQLSHLRCVPFENLSIRANEPILLQIDPFFSKVVSRRRGGFCYELNGLFADLLGQLGFNVTMLSAGVARADGGFGPEFDHLTLMVSLEDRWLVDVGFGDSFQQPLMLDGRNVRHQGGRSYRLVEDGTYLVLKEKAGDDDWKAQYRFTLQPHALADYAEMCHYHQTSPKSTFTQKRVCSLAKPDGRVTLSDMRLITTEGNERREQTLANEEKVAAVLEREFGIIMGERK